MSCWESRALARSSSGYYGARARQHWKRMRSCDSSQSLSPAKQSKENNQYYRKSSHPFADDTPVQRYKTTNQPNTRTKYYSIKISITYYTNMQNLVFSLKDALRLIDEHQGDPNSFTLSIHKSLDDIIGINMSIISEKIYSKGWCPDGFSQLKDHRIYRYRSKAKPRSFGKP